MNRIRLAALIVSVASCASETTSFRTTDKSDGTDRSPSSTAYQVQLTGEPVANVHVWSNGGYIGNSDEPMTHVGFELENTTTRPIVFDGDSLTLVDAIHGDHQQSTNFTRDDDNPVIDHEPQSSTPPATQLTP